MAMYLLRRAAFRALASASPLARNQSGLSTSTCLTKSIPPVSVATVKSSPFSISVRRAYAEEQRDLEEEAKNSAKSFADSAKETASESGKEAQSFIGSATQTASETVERAKDAVTSAVSSGFGSITPDRSDRSDRSERYGNRDTSAFTSRTGRPDSKPSSALYIGNLYFEVTEAGLQKEFSKFGNVTSVKIIYDGRGLSKGFGYIEFADQASATEAKAVLDGQVFEGRRMSVQYALKGVDRPRRNAPDDNGYTNPPSKTLFIGNMSYEMSDKDLNDLFRGIKNVLDVRVAIDRRTGQPRGFAHADFVDVKSAQDAVDFLKSKEFYGRKLRIDYSNNSAGSRDERSSRPRTAE